MKTIYTPIAVSSGELPEKDIEEKADLSVDVFFIDCDNSKHIGFYNFATKEWISYEDCYVAPKLWLKKEEVPELTEWISVKDKLPDNSHGRVLCWCEEVNDLGVSYFFWNCSYSKEHGFTDNFKNYCVTHWKPVHPPKDKVEVKWEENTNTPK